jgi:glutamate:Na+ symporter, ESS family
VHFDLIQTLALAAVGLLIGRGLARAIPLLGRLCLPEPVIGGLALCAVFTVWQHLAGIELKFDLALQSPLMIAFFLSIGWMASWRNLRRGGPAVVTFFLVCCVILITQNIIGIGVAVALGESPLLGAVAGSVSMAGGPGTALAFAPAFEQAGLASAAPVATACALAGIIMGGLLGSPLAARLIARHRLTPDAGERSAAPAADRPESIEESVVHPDLAVPGLSTHLQFFLIVMALGAVLGEWIQNRGITLPVYIGAMAVAAFLRNWQEWGRAGAGRLRYSHSIIEDLGSIALSYFLVMATMTLQLGKLAELAGVLVAILAAQALWVWLVATLFVFRFFGRDYESAVIGAGFTGFMLGTTANAMANLNAVSRRFGPAPRAFLVVPLVGACGIDFANAAVITAILGLFSWGQA